MLTQVADELIGLDSDKIEIKKLLFFENNEFHEYFIGNLINESRFCQSCGLLCSDCRLEVGRFASEIVGVYNIGGEGLPDFLDDPIEHIPINLPEADIVVTTTPSKVPVVMKHHIRPGTHINAIGADARGKQEL